MQLLRPWLVDNAGHVVDRFGLSYPVCRGRLFSCARDYERLYLRGRFLSTWMCLERGFRFLMSTRRILTISFSVRG